jgi:HK97 family phage prohead protease
MQTGVLGHDPGAGPGNGGADGTLSDGTASPSDPNACGWSDGTGRSAHRARHRKWRTAWTEDVELRIVGAGDDTIRVSGTAIVYSPWTTIHDSDGPFQERVMPTAIDSILGDGTERFLLLNHDWKFPLASTHAGNLQLRNTPDGLQMAADLDAGNPTVQHVASSIHNGTMRGMSFAFTLDHDHGDTWNPNMTRRTITRFRDVPEVTICARPAYPTTNVKVVRAIQRVEELRERGERLRRHEEIRLIRDHHRSIDA